MVSYILCNTPPLADTAVSALQSASTLAVSCEGVELGRLTGRLSLLSILAIVPVSDGASRTAFLFDVVNLPNSALAPVFALLVSPVYTKIMFHGRLDYSALCHGHAVALQNVLDLQLADAQARPESERERIMSIEKYLDEASTAYARFHPKIMMLAGLGKCTRLWEFLGCSLIPTSLREQSQRYITRFKAYQPRVGLDHESYDTNGFLPLDILDYVEGSASKKLARAADAKWLFSLSERARVIALCAS
ncbi:hypothetical protein CPB85DRAFT_541449 [Mucidula mucida]|nr:hypothetical protein CPB85DRAFT_541036 [Mucidula mucida]KAF8913607.1 hypothetical protein CPB85DRAFT_541449 [Mucidula mucida]